MHLGTLIMGALPGLHALIFEPTLLFIPCNSECLLSRLALVLFSHGVEDQLGHNRGYSKIVSFRKRRH